MRYEIIMTRDVYLKTPKTYTRFDTCATKRMKLCSGLKREREKARGEVVRKKFTLFIFTVGLKC